MESYQPVFNVQLINRQKEFKVYYAEEGDNTVIEKTFFDVFNKKEEGKEKLLILYHSIWKIYLLTITKRYMKKSKMLNLKY